jgi:hypothetical protein
MLHVVLSLSPQPDMQQVSESLGDKKIKIFSLGWLNISQQAAQLFIICFDQKQSESLSNIPLLSNFVTR